MAKKELDESLLDLVSGGVLKEGVIEQITAGIKLSKAAGRDKFDYMRLLDNYYKEHPYYFSTDGSKEDYDKIMQLILEIYDTVE